MSLLRMSLSGAILIMVVVVIRAIAINKLPQRAFLVFWGIAIVRLLLPISFPPVSSVFMLTDKSVPVLDSVERGISDFTSEILASQQTEIENWTTQVLHDSTPTVSVLFFVWIIGVLLFSGYFLASYLRCRHEFKTSLPVQNNFVEEWLFDHPLRRTMEVRSLTGISTPLTYGLIHPVILIPKKTNWENERQIQYMLFHEYVHICRFDSIGKLIVAATICIHWFNPMVWVLYILFNRDIELACDERVVRHFGETDRAAYARTLIDMEEQRQSFAPFYNCFAKNAIEERIEAIMKFKKKSIYALSVAFILVLIGTIAAFATSASSSQEQSDPSIVNDTDISLGTAWTGGVSFAELAPGEEIARSEKIVISPNENFRYAVTYNRASLILEIGLRSPDGTEYSRTITGGSDDATIENVPAGTYELFVRNSGDYSAFPAYKDGTVSYSATGCINFLLEVSGIEINIDDLYKFDARNKLEFLG